MPLTLHGWIAPVPKNGQTAVHLVVRLEDLLEVHHCFRLSSYPVDLLVVLCHRLMRAFASVHQPLKMSALSTFEVVYHCGSDTTTCWKDAICGNAR